jgi:hypothetical protein
MLKRRAERDKTRVDYETAIQDIMEIGKMLD